MQEIKGRLLYVLANQTGLLLYKMSFYLVDLSTTKKRLVCNIPAGWKNILLSQMRILSRFRRLEPKCCGRLSETEFVVSLLRACWLVDIKKGSCEKICKVPGGFSDVLNFCSTSDGVYWGDYGRNKERREVRVYKFSRDHRLSVVYSFTAGTVRHVHNIECDNQGYFLFTGDNESCSGIYRVNHDWTEVLPWRVGQQKYRAVVGWPYCGGLLYATDSVETENHIRLISGEGNEKVIAPLNGSCIYGKETKDEYLFSTTVEPHEGGGIRSLFIDTLGTGIKSREVTIVAVSKKDLSVRQVASYKKDCWPMKLFQYGRAIFAGGQTASTVVWCSPVACEKYDGKTIKIEI